VDDGGGIRQKTKGKRQKEKRARKGEGEKSSVTHSERMLKGVEEV
jgi:hypothetical protein